MSKANRNSVGLKGHDPVSYFEGKPTQGVVGITAQYDGVTYNFASEQSRDRFGREPARFAPQYGGWCATAMGDGHVFDADPSNYRITDGLLYVFYKGPGGDTRPQWDQNPEERRALADATWKRLNA